ncbi:polysaccharide biosynthesis/export family protein [Algoriphagus oliviformis]|nr:polysaccharide biosynthesis/export family protein [Algoriphagus oliviformis]
MMKKIGFVFLLALTSCISNKKLIYLQDQGAQTQPGYQASERVPYRYEEYVLQKFDIVDIEIKTSIPELNALFEVSKASSGSMSMVGGSEGGGDVFFMNGYTIDEEGNVELPLMGKVELHGMTAEAGKEKIERELVKFVNEGNFFVRVRLGGIRFSALGEFNNPGKLTILQSRATIFEAIAAANDLSIMAKRDEIVLVRQYPDGSQIHRINLNDKNLLASDYYFIKPNDILYAEPYKIREFGNTTNFIQTFTLLTTLVTAVALVLTLVNNN